MRQGGGFRLRLPGGALVLRSRSIFLAFVLALGPVVAPTADAIIPGSISAEGTYQRVGPPDFSVGVGGSVDEIAAFVKPSGALASSQLGAGPLPSGLSLSFASILSGDGTDLVLRYDFSNLGPGALGGIGFVSFLDAEIDEPTFFNEYAETQGALAPGQGFEVDEPGFVFGDIYANALAGTLDGTNAVPLSDPEDVSLALSFSVGPLAPGQVARFEFMISEDGDSIGAFRLVQRDIDPGSTTVITFSGAASVVPEPGTAALVMAGVVVLAGASRRRQ